jgi:hypothetical protein
LDIHPLLHPSSNLLVATRVMTLTRNARHMLAVHRHAFNNLVGHIILSRRCNATEARADSGNRDTEGFSLADGRGGLALRGAGLFDNRPRSGLSSQKRLHSRTARRKML